MLMPFAHTLAKLGLEGLRRFTVGEAQAVAVEEAEPLFHLLHP